MNNEMDPLYNIHSGLTLNSGAFDNGKTAFGAIKGVMMAYHHLYKRSLAEDEFVDNKDDIGDISSFSRIDKNNNKYMKFNFFSNRKGRFEDSCQLSVSANLAFMEGRPDEAHALYQQAISICPENLGPYWPMIAFLHEKNRDLEAFGLFEKVTQLDGQIFLDFKDSQWLNMSGAVPSLCILMPATVGMLVALGKTDTAKEMLVTELQNLQRRAESLKSWDKRDFKTMLALEALTLSLDDSKKLLGLLSDTALEGYISVEELQSLIDDYIEKVVIKAISLTRENKLSDALAYFDFVLSIEINPSKFYSKEELARLQEIIREEIKEEIDEAQKWSLARSGPDFLNYLFRRLIFRFHPDLSVEEKDRTERTKIMQEINQIKEEKDLAKMKEIVKKYVPEWSKYL